MAGPLTIRFATDVEPARKGIASLRTSIVTDLSSMNMAFTQGGAAADAYGDTLSKISGITDTVVTGLAALDAAKGIIKQVGDALNDAQGRLERTLALAQGAQGVGVSGSFFQILTAQAKELGVQTDALVGYLTKARDAATVKLGVGNDAKNESSLQNVLRGDVQVGNLSQGDADSVNGAATQQAKIKAVLDLMDKLREEGKNLAAEDLGRNFFGDDFVTRLRTGVDLIGAMRKALDGADTAGGQRIITDEEIARAEAMKQRVEEINQKYAQGMKPILDDIAYLQDRASAASLEWSNRVADLVVQFGKAYEYVKGLAVEAYNFAKGVGQSVGLIGEDAPKTDTEGGPLTVRVRPRAPRPDTSVARPGAPRKAGGSEAETPDAVDAYIKSLNKARDVQEAELAAVGKTVTERERLLAVARAEAAARDDFENGRRGSAALTDDERKKTLDAAEALGRAKTATQDLEQQQRQAAETARYFGSSLSEGLSDALLDGKSLGSVFEDITKSLAKAVIQAELLGTGPLAGLLGTAPLASAGSNATGGLLGSLIGSTGGSGAAGATSGGSGLAGLLTGFFRAGGGDVQAGRPYAVGEYGREVFVPDSNGRVYPVGAGGGGGSTKYEQHFHDYAGAGVKEQTTTDGRGNRRQDVIIGEAVAQGLRSPQGVAALRQPRIAQRG